MKETTRLLLLKAEHAIRAGEILLEGDEAEFAAGRAYYAMRYVAEALLYERGLAFRKHTAVHAAFGREFASTGLLDPKFHQWLLTPPPTSDFRVTIRRFRTSLRRMSSPDSSKPESSWQLQELT